MKNLLLAPLILVSLIGCGRDHYYTKAGCVTFVVNDLPGNVLAQEAQQAAHSLGYKLIPTQNQDQFTLHFNASEPERSLLLASGLRSNAYFISADVYDAADQVKYGLDPSKMFSLLDARLPPGSLELESTTCAERPN